MIEENQLVLSYKEEDYYDLADTCWNNSPRRIHFGDRLEFINAYVEARVEAEQYSRAVESINILLHKELGKSMDRELQLRRNLATARGIIKLLYNADNHSGYNDIINKFLKEANNV